MGNIANEKSKTGERFPTGKDQDGYFSFQAKTGRIGDSPTEKERVILK